MTEKDLIRFGYKSFPVPHDRLADMAWGRWIYDSNKCKEYYIIIYQYKAGCYGAGLPLNDVFEASCRFYRIHDMIGFDVNKFDCNSLTELEGFYRDVFQSLYCVPDPHN